MNSALRSRRTIKFNDLHAVKEFRNHSQAFWHPLAFDPLNRTVHRSKQRPRPTRKSQSAHRLRTKY